MKCKQVREAIGAASRHNPYSGHIASHLSGCPDCRRYSDETASLLRLLTAQPRVEAPPDFEFRLRARLLRAQAAPAGDPQGFLRPQGFLQRMWPETFSWGQMVAAAAAVALVVTVSTYYIDRDNGAQAPADPGAIGRAVNPQPGVTGPAPEAEAPAAMASAEAIPVKFTRANVKVRPASLQSAEAPSAVLPDDLAGVDGSTRLYSPKTKRLVNVRGRFYGAEPASISLAKPASAALTF